MIDRPIFVCAECTFIGGHPEHTQHVEQTDHWTYRTLNPNGSVVWTTTAAGRLLDKVREREQATHDH